MKTRIITAVVATLLLVPFCIFSATPSFVFLVFSSIIATVGAYEVLKCVSLHKNVVASLLTYAVTLSATVLTRLVSSVERYFLIVSFIFFSYIFLSLVNATFSKGRVKVIDASLASLMTVYVTFSLSSLVLLRDLTAVGEVKGMLGGKLYLLAFIFAWVPDIGGYFFGKFFGKRKLIPDVSPKKTVAGFVGGIGSAVAVSLIYAFIIGAKGVAPFIVLAVIAALSAMVSVCGDLLASLVKRHYGIKDYGFIFPGHGGVMDRFDSVIAVAPFLFILCYIANSFSLFAGFVG